MFDLDRFIEYCRAAVREDSSHKAAREVLARANSDPTAILATLGEPTSAGVTPLYKSEVEHVFLARVSGMLPIRRPKSSFALGPTA